ncbi:hypothetical protein [Sphaerisporangium sp. TRM90804]|uniref:hypothetical protein n=1 Tax=Sphaerisporangium sp. TRM90804 TaxID=3031113 RepID=UPI00244B22C6|nr:hypothetical protein [Sphaerisporangium sp. TRM90804]MDH2424787.1 hypothetical protein [Sphaerisporangium sp. TRM90804]
MSRLTVQFTDSECASNDGLAGPVCPREPAIRVLCGCVHEHLAEVSVCQYHVERLAKGGLACRWCGDADGHDCEMHLIREVVDA